MSALLIQGKQIADEIKTAVQQEILEKRITPGLGVILVSGNAASELYVRLKEKAANQVGIMLHKYILDEDVTTEHIIEAIQFLNTDPHTNGIIVQLPLPPHLDTEQIIQAIAPVKDVDGFHPYNVDRLLKGDPQIIPVICKTILRIIEETDFPTENATAVIISNSDTFPKPIIPILEALHCTVLTTTLQDDTWSKKTVSADILISAVGKPHIITPAMVKPGALLIDIGITKDGNTVYGDVDPEVDSIAGFRTPVPGGVGPITVAMLLANTLELYKQQN